MLIFIVLKPRTKLLSRFLVRLQDNYAKEFITFKPDKQLRWLPHLGTVHLQVHLQDRTVEAETTPLEAGIIELFSQKGESHFHTLVINIRPDYYTRYLDCR
jgi:anaphase-promoting complex subunit 2